MQTKQASSGTASLSAVSNNDWFSSDRRNIALLLGASFLLFFFALASWGFIDPGDGYFSETAREMIERNDYVIPHLNYQIYFSKPVLIYWLIIGAFKVFGINEFAARFWSAALATGMVMCAYWTTRSIISKRAGVIAGVVFASAPLVVTFARMALIDMSFTCLLGYALCATAMTLFTNSRRWWPWIYISLALAVLDKGPAGLALYLIGIAGFAVLYKSKFSEIMAVLGRLKLQFGIPIFTAIAVPWYIAVGLATNWLWPQVFFFFENVGRFAGHTNHRNPALGFYLPVLGYGFFPWILLLPTALFHAVKDRFAARSAVVAENNSVDATENARSYNFLMASWTLGVLVLFSLSLTKLQTYILPAFPAMAILVGIAMDTMISRSLSAKPSVAPTAKVVAAVLAIVGLVASLATVAAIVCGASPDLLLRVHVKWVPQVVSLIADTPIWMRVGLVSLGAFIGVGMLASTRYLVAPGQFGRGVAWMTCVSVIACTVGAPIAFQLGYKYKDADVHAVAAVLEGKPGPVALFHDFKPALIYHLRRPVDTFFSCDQLHDRVPGEPEVQYIITGRKGSAELLSRYQNRLKTLAHKGDWYVFETHDLVALRLPTLERSFKEHIDLSGGDFSWGTLPFAGGTKHQ